MPADEHHVALDAFRGERRRSRRRVWCGPRSEERGAVRIRMSQSRHPIVLPVDQCGGGHGKLSGEKRRSAGIIRSG
jgi:hypothetical protein